MSKSTPSRSDRKRPSKSKVTDWILSKRALIVIVIAAIPRIWCAFYEHGIFFPDEIYQSVEQAHRLAFGYGLVPWEFQVGARSWAFPGVLAGVSLAASAIGLDSARALVITTKLFLALLGIAGVFAAMKIAEELEGPRSGLLGGILGALFPPALFLGARAFSESASAPLIAISAFLSLRSKPRAQWGAGAIAGLAVLFRYQNGLVALGLVSLLLAERRMKDALHFLGGALLLALLGGALDAITWGSPFHSLITYVNFNLIEGKSSLFGTEPFLYYLRVLWASTGVVLCLPVFGIAFVSRRVRIWVITVATFVLIHMLIPHKELRFLMPIAPLALALAGLGIVEALDQLRAPPWSTLVLAVLCAGLMMVRAARLTLVDLGLAGVPPEESHASAWHNSEAVNRLSWSAYGRADLCGLAILACPWGATGGFTYLHRDVPILFELDPSQYRGHAITNYLIAPVREVESLAANGYVRVDEIAPMALYRRSGTCDPPSASYSRQIPGPF